MTRPLAVLKFGSSVLPDESTLPVAVAEVRRHVDRGQAVLAVVSALGGGTDELITRARRLAPEPEPAALAALLATGEGAAAALLGVALDADGLPATVLDPGRVGPLTHGPLLDARPYELGRDGIRRVLEARAVAVLPGFVGRTDAGRTSLLGRGGSDLSALFAAHALGAAECRLLKDVDGVYERDPRRRDTHLHRPAGRLALRDDAPPSPPHDPPSPPPHDAPAPPPRGEPPPPRRYATLTFRDAVDLGDAVVQPKAARFALRHAVVFEVAAPGGGAGTRVGATATVLEPPGPRAPASWRSEPDPGPVDGRTDAGPDAAPAGRAAPSPPSPDRASEEKPAWT